jgi:hypothetical protein
MPYEIRKSGSHYDVINKNTKQSKGKSKSLEMAKAHMRALYANEPKMDGIKQGLKSY